MNLLNLAAVMGQNVPLSALSLCDTILERIYTHCPPLALVLAKEDTGEGILDAFAALPEHYRNCIERTSIVTVMETQVVIHDVTIYRSSCSYKVHQCEIWPRRLLGTAMFAMLLISLYYVAYYVFILRSDGEHLDGAVYDVLQTFYVIVKPFLF